ncbi:MAG: type IV toxin-antitoxin system AbiEi family antitoxin domain-containing protein [Candidatus Odinarchaeia archaeon]
MNDIRKIEDSFDLRRLNEWQGKGYIKMVRRGYYIFSDLKLNESVLFLIANEIYSPSYISLEMAFSYYNLIPESVYGITSVTSQKTNNFETSSGKFIYRHIKPELIFGYKLIRYRNRNFKIAEIEKALLDYFYLNPQLKSEDDFIGVRFNIEEFKNKASKEKINRYLKAFNNKSLEKRIKRFLKYIDYA